jgi:D-alanyl-lipoteichoic acid acyltransferase DltB (MBOAT superfamily)
MLFNSVHFALFFPVATAVYFAVRGRARIYWLVLASSYFYMALVPSYILILLALIAVDYWTGLRIESAKGRARTAWLIGSLTSNILALAIFKYYNFLATTLSPVATFFHQPPPPLFDILLPVGLSFHTFQSMGYTIEVYKGRQRAERNLTTYALYVLFFPQLVAGPIERPQNLLHQFHVAHAFSAHRTTTGLRLMLWGLFKKVVIADRLASIVNHVYSDIGTHDSVALALAAYLFSFQIYCDFSGYSDVARGAARILGVDLMRNFERPYEATSLGEFWRRWHISLSTWFRDYVFIPLGGSRQGTTRTAVNMMAVFMLSGLWHGANWTFVIWGAIHGILVALGVLWARWPLWPPTRTPERPSSVFAQTIQRLVVFNVVTLAWVFFRAPSIADAIQFISRLPFHWTFSVSGHHLSSPKEILFALLLIAGMLIIEWAVAKRGLLRAFELAPRPLRLLTYYVLLFLIVALGPTESQPFIYFQF